jgi:ribose transport system permease protein
MTALAVGFDAGRLRTVLSDYGIFVVLAVLCVVFAATTSTFLTADNLRNLAEQAARPGIIACGATAVILAGEFDLSVGGIYGLAGVVAAVVVNEAGVALAIAAALLAGCVLGALNGVITTRIGIQSFLVTLATGFVIVGVGIIVTGGSGLWRVTDYQALGPVAQQELATVESKAWIMLAIFVAVAVVLRRTAFGAQLYALGGNAAAARIAGVRVHLVRVGVFALSGVLAALAGVLALAETSVAKADGGVGMEFTAITAVVIGGTSIAGGRGGVGRTLVGVLLLAVIANGFNLLYIDPVYNSLVQGAIILLAVVFDARLKRRGAA